MTVTEAVERLEKLAHALYAYEHALTIVYYDASTCAPEKSAEERGESLSYLSGVLYEMQTNPETVEFMTFLREHTAELTPNQARQVELFWREYEQMSKVPQAEYVEFTRLINESDSVWHKAKPQNDFLMFAPVLKQVIDTMRRFAGYYHPEWKPYDVWLDHYEHGLSMEQLDDFFAKLRVSIVPLLKRILTEGEPVDDSFLHQEFPVEKQRLLSTYLMDVMGIDPGCCILGETEHPFTTNTNKHDVRITTHYHSDDFASSMFSVIHEGGHALYELHTSDDLAYTDMATGASMGVHESQSRLFENVIGRSREFLELIYPKLLELFPEQLTGVDVHKFWRAINKVEPSLIRTEADELTYCLHVMVRYDIEKLLLSGEAEVSRLPELWNAKYKEYLGIDVPDDTRGVLQDSHWSNGNVGYFPSYAIGSAYSAQIVEAMRKDLDVEAIIRSGSLTPILAWLEERIWKYGSSKDPDEIMLGCCGTPFDPTYYTDYLTRKYSEVYHLK